MWFINASSVTTLVQDVDSRGGFTGMEEGDMWEISISSSIAMNLKLLKKKVFKLQKKVNQRIKVNHNHWYNPSMPTLNIYPRYMKTCLVQHGDYSQWRCVAHLNVAHASCKYIQWRTVTGPTVVIVSQVLQIITLYTWNSYNVIHQLYLSKKKKCLHRNLYMNVYKHSVVISFINTTLCYSYS